MLSMAFGVLVFVGLSAYADFSAVIDGLEHFKWLYLPLILGLTCVNYALRFVKWQFYLKTIEVEGLAPRDSALVYYAGLGMVVTPGKVGEWLKCYLLRELHGTPFSRSAPIVIAERLTDSLGLVILGAAGLVVFGSAWPAFVVIIVGAVALVVLARHQPLAYWVLGKLEKLPLVSRFAQHAEEFYKSSYVLLSPRVLGSMTLLSVVSWGFEVLAFYVTLLGVGVDGGADLLLEGVVHHAGRDAGERAVADAGRSGRGRGRHHRAVAGAADLPKSQAAVATLVIRFCTLWFGVIVGFVALGLVSRSLPPGKSLEEATEATAGGGGQPVVTNPVTRVLPRDPASRAATSP